MGGLVTDCVGVQWLPSMLRHMGGETREGIQYLTALCRERGWGARVQRETVENPCNTWLLLLNTAKATGNQLNM